MKKLTEFVTIKNLNTDETTTVDDEGNIEEFGEEDFEGFDGFSDDDLSHNLRPDGSDDGLDDLGDVEGLDDPFADELSLEELPNAEESSEEETEEFGQEDTPFDEESEQEEGDPDFQGVIRTVTGACLVYKRKTEEGTFEELWVLNVGKNMRNEVKTRRAILAGTDIPPQGVSSEDGTQEVETTTIGNAQFLRVTGLPN